MDVRTLAVVARAGIEALKYTKKKREAEEKARLEKEAAKAAALAEKEAEAERKRLAAAEEAEAEAKAKADAEAAEDAEAEKRAAEEESAQTQHQESAATEAEPESAAASQADTSQANEANSAPEAPEDAKPQPAPEVKAESQPAAASEAKAEAKTQAEAKKMETKSADKSSARQKRKYRPALIRLQALGSLLSGIMFLGLFSVYLVTEVVTAMAVYIYLATNQADFLTFLDVKAQQFIGYIRQYLELFFPQFDQQLLNSMFSQLGSRAVLLLFLALATSAAIRFLLWGTGVVLDGLRAQAEQAPKSSPAKAQSSEAKAPAS